MGKAQRIKGHSWERSVAESLRHIDEKARRLLEYQEGMGIDIETSLPLRIQCKCGAQASKGISGLLEAGDHPDKYSVCALKIDRKGEFAVLRWEDFVEIFTNYWLISKM